LLGELIGVERLERALVLQLGRQEQQERIEVLGDARAFRAGYARGGRGAAAGGGGSGAASAMGGLLGF
jgi:hypothetical protein